MRIRIENKYGSFSIGGSGNDIFDIKAIEGLGLPDITLNTVQYAGQEGRETLSSSREYRTITISGDIKGKDKDRAVRRAIKILSAPVDVLICVGNRKRRLSCRCTSFTPPYGKQVYKDFVLQIECDSPYFSDDSKTEKKVYSREKLLPFDYASYFGSSQKAISILTNRAVVTNAGDVRAEPVIKIQNTGGVADLSSGIVIQNETTGQKVTLLYTTKANETVTLDIPGRTIKNDAGENLINTLSNDSYLSDFWLEEGANTISVTTNGSGERVVVSCEFYNQYLEVMD